MPRLEAFGNEEAVGGLIGVDILCDWFRMGIWPVSPKLQAGEKLGKLWLLMVINHLITRLLLPALLFGILDWLLQKSSLTLWTGYLQIVS